MANTVRRERSGAGKSVFVRLALCASFGAMACAVFADATWQGASFDLNADWSAEANWDGGVPGANDAALEISFAKATGIWKGSFLWWFDTPKHASTKVPFEGVMVQGEDLEGFGTYDVSASYVPYDKKGNPQKEKTYKVKESLPVRFARE